MNILDQTYLRLPRLDDLDLTGQRVLVRVDFNVPINESTGKVDDDLRIIKSLDTINYLRDKGCKIVLMSHLGRPAGKPDQSLSLKLVKPRLDQLLNTQTGFVSDIYDQKAVEMTMSMKPKEVVLLENLRFYPGEEAAEPKFAEQLAGYGDYFIQDGFAVVHRRHASTVTVANHFDAKHKAIGRLVEQEINQVLAASEHPKSPSTVILGGAKLATKIPLLEKFVAKADNVIITGAMANDFLKVMGHKIGNSLYDPESLDQTQRILDLAKAEAEKRRFNLIVPVDVIVGETINEYTHPSIVDLDSMHYSDVVFYPKKPPSKVTEVEPDEIIADIGPYTTSLICGILACSNSVIWNGLAGVVETPGPEARQLGPFEFGSFYIMNLISRITEQGAFSLVCGGDTAGYIHSHNMQKHFSHVSTGGGASLALISGEPLPGLDAISG